MTKPILPGSLQRPQTAPTSTAHVNPHAHGAKKGVRGKSGQPGEIAHEESYADKIDEHPPVSAGRRVASGPGAGLSLPMGARATKRDPRSPLEAGPRGQPGGQPPSELQQANRAKQALSQLLGGGSPHAPSAQLALRGMDQKISLALSLAPGNAQMARAQGAVAGLDAKIGIGLALAQGSPHLAAAQAAFGRIHALTERLANGA